MAVPRTTYETRIESLRKAMCQQRLDAFLIKDMLNIRYLTGFTGSFGILIVSVDSIFLLTDGRYIEQASLECPWLSVEPVVESWTPAVIKLLESLHVSRAGFEDNVVEYRTWRGLKLARCKFIPAGGLVEELRMVKDPSEIGLIRRAVSIADIVYSKVIRQLEPGVREKDLALEIDCCLRRNGADKEGFNTIVASGPSSALPHASAGDRIISKGDLVIFDYGAKVSGYHSDITRTIVVGRPTKRQTSIHSIVLEAQSRAIDAIRPGVKGGEIDEIARSYITKCGYGDHFVHGLGHGIGLAVHDGRILGRNSDFELAPGMVLTVEPGIYIPGWGGVRVEDDVLVTQSGCEILTKSPRALVACT